MTHVLSVQGQPPVTYATQAQADAALKAAVAGGKKAVVWELDGVQEATGADLSASGVVRRLLGLGRENEEESA